MFVSIWVVARLVWGSDDRIAFQAVQPVVSLPEYLQQLVLVQLWDSPFFDGASWVGSTWSISAEWLAYLLFPVAALVFHRLRDLPVALLAAGSLALMTPIAWAYLLTGSPYHPWSWAVRVLCGFGAGVLAQLVVRRLPAGAPVLHEPKDSVRRQGHRTRRGRGPRAGRQGRQDGHPDRPRACHRRARPPAAGVRSRAHRDTAG